jgi:pimeloyl-ACP methyl ester carboxylesterase
VTPTLRHHDVAPRGTPDPRLGRTSLLDYAEDLEKLIRGLAEEPVVMGFSMGGIDPRRAIAVDASKVSEPR